MGRGPGGIIVAAISAALLCVPAAAQAAQGSDSVSRYSVVSYKADPGEENHFTMERLDNGWLHLRDPGAIIRWISIPALSDCFGGLHDAYCLNQYGGWDVYVDLGDRSDTFVNSTQVPATVYAQDGEVDRISCAAGDGTFDAVYVDPEDLILTPGACGAVHMD